MAKECFYMLFKEGEERRFHEAYAWIIENSAPLLNGWIAITMPQGFTQYGTQWKGAEFMIELSEKPTTRIEFSGISLSRILWMDDTPRHLNMPADGHGWPMLVLHPIIEEYLDQLDKIPNISKMLIYAYHKNKDMLSWIERNNAKEYLPAT